MILRARGAGLPRLGQAGVYTVALWLVLSALALSLHLAVLRSSWHEPLLPLRGRLSLLLFELGALLPLAALAGATVALERHAGGAGRRGWMIGRVLALALLLFGLIASWGLFYGTGQFLDAGSIGMLASDPIQLFRHVRDSSPGLAFAPPLAAIALAVLLALGLPRVSRSASVGIAWWLPALVLLVVLLTRALAIDARLERSRAPVADADAGGVYTLQDLYRVARADRAGPLLHFVTQLAQDPAREPAFADPTMPRELRPQTTLAQYVATVERDSLRPLNVLLILVESLRADQLVVSGGTRVVMPAVEALAARGITWPRTYAQASHSNYADMVPLSSQYPLRSAHYHVYPEQPTYPRVLVYDLLDALGYRTAVISSQNENWGGMLNYLRTDGLDHLMHAETYEGPTYVPRGDVGFEAYVKSSRRAGKIDDRFTVASAIEWIGDGDRAPFFIYMNLQNSHIPYEVPADFDPPFGPHRVSFPIVFGGFPRDSIIQVMNQYANSLAYVDAQIGKVIEHLRSTGQLERTVVIVTGDTGQGFFEHGFAAHANRVYDELVRVPLVIAAPGLDGRREERIAEHLDVAPTVLDLLGLPPHPGFQGRSLLAPPPPAPTAFVMVQTPLAHQYGIVRDGYKLIYDVRRDRYFLYDLLNDPGETVDLQDDAGEIRASLARYLDTWRQAQLEYYRSEFLQQRYYQPDLSAAIEHAPPLRTLAAVPPAEPAR